MSTDRGGLRALAGARRNGHIAVESMTPSQLRKRRLATDSVIRLVEEHGVENVNMKAVSLDSGVALATLYRFFNSKDHLFAVALMEWQRPLLDRGASEEATALRSPRDIIMRYVRRGTKEFQRNQKLLSFLVYGVVSTDPFASEQMHEFRIKNVDALASRLPTVPEPARHTVVEIIEGTWWDILLQWHTGRATVLTVFERMEQIVNLLVGDENLAVPLHGV